MFMPSYVIALSALIVIMLLEVGGYLIVRNSKVGLKDLGDDFHAWTAGMRGAKHVKVVAGAVTDLASSSEDERTWPPLLFRVSLDRATSECPRCVTHCVPPRDG